MRRFRLRSLRNRLAVVFGLIVMGAIATVYLSTIPRLEDRLTEQKLDALEADARDSSGQLVAALDAGFKGEVLAKRVTDAASRSSAEVLVLTPLKQPDGLTLEEDSTLNGGIEAEEVTAIGVEALRTRKPQTATVTAGVGRRSPRFR